MTAQLYTWGYFFIAYIIDSVAYGVAMVLIGQYFYSNARDDKVYLRLTVGALAVLATIHIVFFGHHTYTDFVTRFGDVEALDFIIFSLPLMLAPIYLVAFISQMFFASRIWIITRHSVLFAVPIVTLSFLQVGAGIAQSVACYQVRRWSRLESTVVITSIQSGAAAICDVLITVTMCYVLHGSRSGLRRTDAVIDKLIVYMLHRGIGTSVAALLNLIMFIAVPHTFYHTIPLALSTQFYVISMVSTLTTRDSLRSQLNATSTQPVITLPVFRESLASAPGAAEDEVFANGDQNHHNDSNQNLEKAELQKD